MKEIDGPTISHPRATSLILHLPLLILLRRDNEVPTKASNKVYNEERQGQSYLASYPSPEEILESLPSSGRGMQLHRHHPASSDL